LFKAANLKNSKIKVEKPKTEQSDYASPLRERIALKFDPRNTQPLARYH